jgi:integrase
LSAALQAAVELELLSRNPAASATPPAPHEQEVRILGPSEITAVLEALRGDRIFAIVSLALATGMRRGELLALRWSDVNFTKSVVNVERSLEETRAGGLRFKKPKNNRSRTIPIGEKTVAMLRAHRVDQLELRMKLGAGKLAPEALVFADHEDKPIGPNYLSLLWRRASKGVVDTNLHALRHTYASALIKAGVDVVTVSTRLGHHSPSFTLRVYAKLFDKDDTTDVEAIERLL